MAILIEEKKKAVNVVALSIGAVVLAIIILGVYFLFFAPTPAIEVIIPAPLEAAEKISQSEFDPVKVVNSPAFRSLRPDTTVTSVGALGRDNPFLGF